MIQIAVIIRKQNPQRELKIKLDQYEQLITTVLGFDAVQAAIDKQAKEQEKQQNGANQAQKKKAVSGKGAKEWSERRGLQSERSNRVGRDRGGQPEYGAEDDEDEDGLDEMSAEMPNGGPVYIQSARGSKKRKMIV